MVKYPHHVKAYKLTKKLKFYMLHESHMHNTNESVHLNDAIKWFIKKEVEQIHPRI